MIRSSSAPEFPKRLAQDDIFLEGAGNMAATIYAAVPDIVIASGGSSA